MKDDSLTKILVVMDVLRDLVAEEQGRCTGMGEGEIYNRLLLLLHKHSLDLEFNLTSRNEREEGKGTLKGDRTPIFAEVENEASEFDEQEGQHTVLSMNRALTILGVVLGESGSAALDKDVLALRRSLIRLAGYSVSIVLQLDKNDQKG